MGAQELNPGPRCLCLARGRGAALSSTVLSQAHKPPRRLRSRGDIKAPQGTGRPLAGWTPGHSEKRLLSQPLLPSCLCLLKYGPCSTQVGAGCLELAERALWGLAPLAENEPHSRPSAGQSPSTDAPSAASEPVLPPHWLPA